MMWIHTMLMESMWIHSVLMESMWIHTVLMESIILYLYEYTLVPYFLIYRLKTCFSFESDFSNYVFKNLPILQPVKITWYRLYILLNKQNILNMCNVFINFHRVQNKKFDFCNFVK